MFERLQERLETVFRRLRGRGRLTEADVDEALREIRVALLEADVNFRIVKQFCSAVREQAVGEHVLQSLSPGQQVATIVHDQLIELMGSRETRLAQASRPPTVYALVGLQGAGKTTTAGKLAVHLVQQGFRPLLAAADVRRPAAIEQLRVVADKAGVGFLGPTSSADTAETIGRQAVAHAARNGFDPVIIDTAGRLHIDEELMAELVALREAVRPTETLLVADAMMGQDAVSTAERFRDLVGIDGIILTKIEGDARGGAALSIRAVTGCPIKFVGTGERLEQLEPFRAKRFASRILGLGDIDSLLEKAQHAIDEQKTREIASKLRDDRFTLQDFVDQLKQVRAMGPLDQVLQMLPGMGKLKKKHGLEVDERQLDRIEAMVNSMTPAERHDPDIINGSRRKRIARGSGMTVQDVNRLLRQFAEAKKMLRQVKGLGGRGPMGAGPLLP